MVQRWSLGSVLKERRPALVGLRGRWVGEGILFFLCSFFGYTGSSLLCRLSLVVVSGGSCLVALHGLLIVAASLLAECGLLGSRNCGTWA